MMLQTSFYRQKERQEQDFEKLPNSIIMVKLGSRLPEELESVPLLTSYHFPSIQNVFNDFIYANPMLHLHTHLCIVIPTGRTRRNGKEFSSNSNKELVLILLIVTVSFFCNTLIKYMY